jgi:hypothetical protein
VLVDAMLGAPSSHAHLITARMGGAIERVPIGATAFAHRTAANLLWIINYWDDPKADDECHRGWVNDVLDATLPYGTGGSRRRRSRPRSSRVRRGHILPPAADQAPLGFGQHIPAERQHPPGLKTRPAPWMPGRPEPLMQSSAGPAK